MRSARMVRNCAYRRGTLTLEVGGLVPWTVYIPVSAEDAAGNVGIQPLAIVLRTPDDAPQLSGWGLVDGC